jgi:hypothetical protein
MVNERPPSLISRSSFTTIFRAWKIPDAGISAEEAASTLFRFFRSRHVADLRFIAGATLLLVFLLSLFILLAGFFKDAGDENKFVAWLEFVVKYIGPALGVGGIVVAWAYRSASARLGVVDLFAAEIITLCRVGTIFDVGQHYVDLYKMSFAPKSAAPDGEKLEPARFNSQEDYFPIFDKNAHDLQILEAAVVTHISEFYTYMKATRDTQRNLPSIDQLPVATPGLAAPTAESKNPWCIAVSNVIYMLFLGYESGRKAVDDLIEFEPNAAEAKMVILITELTCYSFLRDYFKADELRHGRLELREKDYKRVVPEVCHKVTLPHGKDDQYWDRARRIAPALARRYKETFPEERPLMQR